MNFETVINKVFREVKQSENQGKLATYIPELACIDHQKLGVCVARVDGQTIGKGDCKEAFSIQSIAKVLALSLAYKTVGESLWKRVGVEPSGNAYNSLVQLENDNGIPRNPFINAGAMVVVDILLSELPNPKPDLLAFIRSLSAYTEIDFNPKIAASERSCGYRNVALCNYIKALGNIKNEPDDVLDFYFDLCSIEANCEQLASIFLFLANDGKTCHTNQQIVSLEQSKRINALMQTCGFYDESGEFAFKVGLPGKSGVGGGIVAIHPDQYAIAVWSPKLNAKGNSYRGMKFLEAFTSTSEMSIF